MTLRLPEAMSLTEKRDNVAFGSLGVADHAPDQNLEVDRFLTGIKTGIAILLQLGEMSISPLPAAERRWGGGSNTALAPRFPPGTRHATQQDGARSSDATDQSVDA